MTDKQIKQLSDIQLLELYKSKALVCLCKEQQYVGVLVRERWVVIPNEEVSDDGDGLKPRCDYRKGDSGWLLASYHDSCWTSDGVQSTIYKNRERINTLSTNFKNWYEKIEMVPDLIKTFERLTSSDRTRENYYEVGKNLLKL